MRFTVESAAAILAFGAPAFADLCSQGSTEVGGNWYCQAVSAIEYGNVGSSGSYNQITAMNSDGSCTSTPKAFSGPLAPLDGEVSMHFRGPLALKQFAVYHPTSSSKREEPHAHQRRHGHGHQDFHKRGKNVEERAIGDMVYATIDGVLVSWVNEYGGASSTAVSSAASTSAAASSAATSAVPSSSSAASSSHTSESSSDNTTVTGTYTRTSYYDSASGTADNVVFLGNYGGSGSGVWDTTFGNSLSYVDSSGTAGASSATVLADTTLPSDSEIVIMTGQECSGDDCGYYRDGAVAYHGFDGADKIFMMEFSMPSDSSSGFNADMPAIWMLNAEIPRTLQYGSSACSCWESGCGEFDIMEVLSSGSQYCKSTFHMNVSGGDSDYITRPTSSTMKIAVTFSSASKSARIQVLDDSTEFGTSLDTSAVNSITSLLEETLDLLLSKFTLS